MFNDAVFEGKTVLVTGGARGIGAAIVTMFAKHKAQVVFLYNRSQEKAFALQDELKGEGYQVEAMQCDIRDKEQCAEVIEAIYDKYEHIDVLVNNSGVVRDNLLVGLTEDDIRAVFDTNLVGTFNVTQAVVPFMMRQRYGKIINISSVAGTKAGRGQANYAATKGGVNAFTQAMAVELAPRNITVNAVAPGVIETEMSKTVRDLGGDEALSKILLKRYGQPEEVAYTVAFMASKYADYMTGQVIGLDGGFKMA